MKIEKLILKNFASIKNAMNSNKITIDFTKCKNNICLFIGDNGSGKTSILSQLQPFANLGNLDIRNEQPLILKDKEGYKEIHIRKKDIVYVIKHYYTPKKEGNHSVKSYISKNGEELNPNGNVTSFKEYVKLELHIEPDYLKLIRLGSNVKSLIGLTETERKSFMSNILDEIGVYLNYYKSVGEKLRQFKELISHTVNKMEKLGITDRDVFIKIISDMEKELERYDKEKKSITERLSIVRYELSKIENGSELRYEIAKLEKKISKMTNIIENKNKLETLDVSFYEKDIKEKEILLSKNKNSIEAFQIIINNTNTLLDSYRSQYNSLSIQYDKLKETEKEIDKMNENLKSIRLRIRESEDFLKEYKPAYSLDELERFVVDIKNLQLMLNKTYDFGNKPIKKAIELIKKNKNISKYVNSHLIDIDEKNSKDDSLLINRLSSLIKVEDKNLLNCGLECSAKRIYKEIEIILKDHNTEEKTKMDASFYKDVEYAYNNITYILKEINNRSDFISLIQDSELRKSFTLDSLFSKIEKMEIIYDEEKINDLLLLSKEYDNYLEYKSRYNLEKENILKFSSINDLESVKSDLDKVKYDISEKESYMRDIKEEIHKLIEENKELELDLERENDIVITLTSYDDTLSLCNELKTKYSSYKKNNDELQDLSIKDHSIDITIDNHRKRYEGLKIDLIKYDEYRKELKKYNKIFEDLTLIRSALSSKEGIPLHYIFNYLGDTVAITNELLDVVFNGESYIDKFEISPTSFSIPFYSKGYYLPDVKYASQGELAFLTIALSFALSSKSLSDYNIMLLDEADAALDVKKREMFIKIIEAMREKEESEQTFAITHNEMFSFYPIDIIDLSFKNRSDEYPMANFIEIEKE